MTFLFLPTGAMLLYVSADGCLGNAKHTDDSKCCHIELVDTDRNIV